MKFTLSIAAVAAIVIGVAAVPTNETLKREEFAMNNKRELEARCNPAVLGDYRFFHQGCNPGYCECLGKFGCWSYNGEPYICQCGPDGPYSC